MKKLLKFIRLKAKLKKLAIEINETLELQDVSEVYSKNVCNMEGWDIGLPGAYYTNHFCALQFAFMSGYIKSMHDNGYEFRDGLIKAHDIAEEMPCGSLRYYKEDIIKETNDNASDILRQVLEECKLPKHNINVIINKFNDKL